MHSSGFISKSKIAVVSVLSLAATGMTAGASTIWTWDYSGSAIAASGTFITVSTPDASGGYLITGITGTRNGQLINGLQAPGTSIPGNEPFTVDNLLFPGPGPQLTSHGVGFSISDGTYSNPFYADFLPTLEYLEFFSIPGIGHTELPVTFSAAPATTPEPSTFALVFGGFAVVSGFLLREMQVGAGARPTTPICSPTGNRISSALGASCGCGSRPTGDRRSRSGALTGQLPA
jgi:hypothetical protein